MNQIGQCYDEQIFPEKFAHRSGQVEASYLAKHSLPGLSSTQSVPSGGHQISHNDARQRGNELVSQAMFIRSPCYSFTPTRELRSSNQTEYRPQSSYFPDPLVTAVGEHKTSPHAVSGLVDGWPIGYDLGTAIQCHDFQTTCSSANAPGTSIAESKCNIYDFPNFPDFAAADEHQLKSKNHSVVESNPFAPLQQPFHDLGVFPQTFSNGEHITAINAGQGGGIEDLLEANNFASGNLATNGESTVGHALNTSVNSYTPLTERDNAEAIPQQTVRHSQLPTVASSATLVHDNSADIDSAELSGLISSHSDFQSPEAVIDPISILNCVAARPNPEIDIVMHDVLCAFVVCDVTAHDDPIVYASEGFTQLTGYTAAEVLGRNCRFLQNPTGENSTTNNCTYTDWRAIHHLKSKIGTSSEVQTSLINYRKGGQSFLNLLTIVPICWNSNDYNLAVGFLLDLVENPQAVTRKTADTYYAVNYQPNRLTQYLQYGVQFNSTTNDTSQPKRRSEARLDPDQVGSYKPSSARKNWIMSLINSSSLLFHIISASGVLVYLSSSSSKMLGYEEHELVGTSISSICHPCDIVSVMRSLNDIEAGSTISLVYRIRRKNDGYAWFESQGTVSTKPSGQGKCSVFLGRVLTVYSLPRSSMIEFEDIEEKEIWGKISTSGILLFISGSVRTLLDRKPDDMVGKNMRSIVAAHSIVEFDSTLATTSIGKQGACTVELQHRRGHILPARLTLYAGDMCEIPKPSFLIFRIQFLKVPRLASVLQRLPTRKPQMVGSPSDQSIGSAAGSYIGLGQCGLPENFFLPSADSNHNGANTDLSYFGQMDQGIQGQENIFEELEVTRGTNWQMELENLVAKNRALSEELQSLLARKKKRKRKKGGELSEKYCSRCHTRSTPEWRRGPSGNRDLCNSCGLRWAKQNGRILSRKPTAQPEAKRFKSAPDHRSPFNPID